MKEIQNGYETETTHAPRQQHPIAEERQHSAGESGLPPQSQATQRGWTPDNGNLNAIGDGGYTRMGNAVLTGNVDQVRCLIEQGVDIYHPVHKSMTVLRLAEICDRVEVVEALCQLGIDPSAKQADGNTELHSLMGFSPRINRLVVAAARDLEARNELGLTALQYAAWCNKEAVVQALLDGGSDIEARDERGCTALMYAASRGNSELVSCLLARHADVHACDKNGKNALYYALRYGTSDTAHVLVQAGAALDSHTVNYQDYLLG